MIERTLILLVLMACPFGAAFSADTGQLISEDELAAESRRAHVALDGQVLFSVRGTSTFPAERRAAGIAERIHEFAEDKNLAVSSLKAVDNGQFVVLSAGDKFLLRIYDADAQADHVSRTTEGELFRQRLSEAITRYREARTPRSLVQNVLIAIAVTLAALLVFSVLRRLFRWLEKIAERKLQTHLESLQMQSHQIIQAKPLQSTVQGIVRGALFVLTAILAFAWLDFTLSCFPWTRPIAFRLFPIVLNPLKDLGLAFIQSIPNLVFLVILVLMIRYMLKLIRIYFGGLERGTIQLENFDQDWAWPTYKIVRLLIISFAAVIAYPYIPGSSSEAFKGVSLFLGVVFSLGSSSVIANMIAGYSLTYRRAFKLGDYIKVGDVRGSVSDSGLMVTRVRTPKNEIVVVPNSTILNNEVVNFTSMARTGELILYTTVCIGYETSWRQVEAMLLQAADRTPGLLKQPPPFVRLRKLGEFAVEYEINVYCNEATKMILLYSLLHQNILDLFNENNIQIMTPAYESDPETPKVVPKNKWVAALAGQGKGSSS